MYVRDDLSDIFEITVPQNPNDVNRSSQAVEYDADNLVNDGDVIPPSKRFSDDVDFRFPQVVDHKQQQFDILQNANPMTDDYHTGIRTVYLQDNS